MGGGGSKQEEKEGNVKQKRKHKDRSGTSHSGHHGRYGSFAEDHETFVWEAQSGPWRLFLLAVVAMLKNVAGLLMLYWVLVSQKQYLMQCDSRVHPMSVVLSCEYTKAFLRAFPLLASSVSLVVAKRVMLQQRVYYGILKIGGLLDFKNTNGLRDPLVWLLAISLVHGVGHFILKIYFGNFEMGYVQELGIIVQKFLVPSFIFMAFFYASYDVEKTLIPLSKYFEEDVAYAKRTLGSMYSLQEDVIREEIAKTDIVSYAAHPHIKEVYKVLIHRYHRVFDGFDGNSGRVCGCELRLFRSMWPAVLLLDGRLKDVESVSFRRMFMIFAVLCSLVQVLILVAFSYQVYHDIYIDVYLQGEYEDLGSFFVMLVHLLIIFLVLMISLYSGFPSLFGSCCGQRASQP